MMEANDIDGRIREIMADILEVDPGVITTEFGKEDARLWDSIRHLYLVTAIEEEFGIKLTMEQIVEIGNFGQLRQAIQTHQ